MSDDSIAKAAENALGAAQLQPETLESLKGQYEKAAQVFGPAGWHGPLDIETLVGLEGQFLWPEEPFNFRTITFTFDPATVGFQGEYKIVSGVFTVEEGDFFCAPNNPAISFAFISLVPQGGTTPRALTFAGMFTDNNWEIIIALLNKLGSTGPIQPPFSAVRIS